MNGLEDADTTGEDITVLRSNSGGRAGKEAATPRVLKQRFVLEDKLGSGGMGTVYRAKDLRKVEARDRYPFVAVKVLNADFRAHPDAFVALQREASKSQAIAHPNIVSIFDFDKDGDIPYMTMELLEGRELTRVLRDHPDGLPDEMAWPIIRGLCAGLTRAHEAGITHADFKPGNVYVTRGNEPKILDFGIARAVRLNQSRGDDTVFDPAKLAALTPAYASKAMLQGETPVPSDDIYAFAVVVYLIFAGRHPYDRVRADEADRQGLVPERIKRLERRQWRMLARCLAFNRADRPASMQEVARGLIDARHLGPARVSAIAAAVIVAATTVWFAATRSERETVARDAVAEAQVTRVQDLLGAPDFDVPWELKLAEAMRQLEAVPGAELELARSAEAVRLAYVARIAAEHDVAELGRLLAGAEAALGTPFEAGRTGLVERMNAEMRRLLELPARDAAWLLEMEALLDEAMRVWPVAQTSADVPRALVQRALAAYVSAVETAFAEADLTRAEAFLQAAAQHLPETLLPEPANERLLALQAGITRQRAREAAQRARAELDTALAGLANVSCQRLDVPELARNAERLTRAYPAAAARITERAVAAVTGCIATVGATDRDRAMALRQSALAAFGEQPALVRVDLDPCALQYLVGHGTEPGRSGFCVDVLDGDAQGPRLVVVPYPGSAADDPNPVRFAIGKYEVSRRELGAFCRATGECDVAGADDVPAHGITADFAQRYAAWLSRETGRQYRLPTLAEWHAAAGVPDPNRNCLVQLAGVDRGGALWPSTSGAVNAFGLVNAFGNVQEWVIDGDRMLAAGGAFADPLERCVAGFTRPHDGSADAQTGFRLVREVT